jgi:hypothetical protein
MSVTQGLKVGQCEDALLLNKVGVALIIQRCVTCCNVPPVRIIELLVMVWGLLQPF